MLQKKVLVCSKRPKKALLNILQLFLANVLLFFLVIFMKNCFSPIFLICFTCCQQKFFVNFEIFKYWIESNIFLCYSKKPFFGAKFDPKTYKQKLNFHPKQNCWVTFSYKNWTYWFLRENCEISAHTDVPNLFSIMNCLFAMNWNPVIPFWF